MSEWITDREPTDEDVDYGIPGYNGLVFATDSMGQVTITSYYWAAHHGFPWQPIIIPEPYMMPKRFEIWGGLGSYQIWDKQNNNAYMACCIPTREAAEEIVAIYERTMP